MNSWKLANEIYNVIRANKIVEEMLPHVIVYVIDYHMQDNKILREECKWNCAKLDENKPDGWYDGFMCPTCGYVRGMSGKIK